MKQKLIIVFVMLVMLMLLMVSSVLVLVLMVSIIISFMEDVMVLAVFEVFTVQFFFCVAGCGKLLLQKLKSEFVEGTDCGPAVEGRGAIDHHSAGQ